MGSHREPIFDRTIYLRVLHFPIKLIFDEAAPGMQPTLIVSALYAAVVLACSACCYYWFEFPLYKMLLRLKSPEAAPGMR